MSAPRFSRLFWGLLLCLGWVGTGGLVPDVQAQDVNALFRQFNYHHDKGNYDRSEQIARSMLRVSYTTGWQAASLNCLGRACHSLEKYDEAEGYFRQAMKIQLNGDNVNRGWVPNNLALVYMDQERLDEAEPLLQQALQNFRQQKGEQSSEVATIYNNLGRIAHDREDYKQSEHYHRQALSIRQSVFGSSHQQVSYSLSNLGDIYRHLEQWSTAEDYLTRAVRMKRATLGEEHGKVAQSLNVLGFVYRGQKRYQDAVEADREALAIREKVFGKDSPIVADSLENLAKGLEQDGQAEDAKVLIARANKIREISGSQSIAEDSAAPAAASKTASKTVTRVEVTSAEAKLYDGPDVIGVLTRGSSYEIRKTNGPWYSVEATVNGKTRRGWLLNTDVRLVRGSSGSASAGSNLADASADADAELRWQTFSPPGGRFEVSMPGSPKALKQTVNGIVNHAFEVDTLDAKYLISWFDIPSGSTLSFDAAIGAYTNARKATLQSQQDFDIDLYPGREFTVKRSSSGMSRMQLLAVGSRWYQLIVEGDADAINNQNSQRFFRSFKLD